MARPARSPKVAARIAGVGLLIAANIGLTTVCWMPPAFVRRFLSMDVFAVAGAFLLLTQLILLSLWLAWSDLAALLRWVIAAALLLALFVSATQYGQSRSLGATDAFYDNSLVVAMVLLSAHAALLPLRVGQWR